MAERDIEERERRKDPAARTPARPAAGASAAILRLQRQVGNRATRQVLSRDTGGWQEGPGKKVSSRLEFDGLAAFELLSFSRADHHNRHEPGASLNVSFRDTDAAVTARLAQASASGKVFESARLSTTGSEIAMTNVVIASFQSGGGGDDAPLVSMSLDAEQLTQKPT